MAVGDLSQAGEGGPLAAGSARLRNRAVIRIRESVILALLVGCALFSIAITVTIIVVLFGEGLRFFAMPEASLAEFFGSFEWNPTTGGHHFGVWPLVTGTFMVTLVAMLVAMPLGLITAIYLSEYAAPRVRAFLKPALEILAGVPTVIYGYFAVTAITPALKSYVYSGIDQFNILAAGLAVGILCLPTISSLAEDALRAVPRSLREAAYGLGGTKFDVSLKVVLPAALSGIISAFLLAVARAIGETMIVALAAGSQAQFTFNPTRQAQTMTGYMAATALGDTSNFGVEYFSVFAVGALLFCMTMALTLAGQAIRRRFREEYQ
ncbi:MAG: phosphate ABC transporter permease subunit PstC [Planctomycetales bacterium]|nr:phosphate ABC transporter permease subunit PstC [Planctomycetales bacterium]